jgi:hypothetical protein
MSRKTITDRKITTRDDVLEHLCRYLEKTS